MFYVGIRQYKLISIAMLFQKHTGIKKGKRRENKVTLVKNLKLN